MCWADAAADSHSTAQWPDARRSSSVGSWRPPRGEATHELFVQKISEATCNPAVPHAATNQRDVVYLLSRLKRLSQYGRWYGGSYE